MEFIAASKIQDHVRKSARNRKLTQTVGKRADYILYAIRRVQSRFMSRLVRKRFLKLRETSGYTKLWISKKYGTTWSYKNRQKYK